MGMLVILLLIISLAVVPTTAMGLAPKFKDWTSKSSMLARARLKAISTTANRAMSLVQTKSQQSPYSITYGNDPIYDNTFQYDTHGYPVHSAVAQYDPNGSPVAQYGYGPNGSPVPQYDPNGDIFPFMTADNPLSYVEVGPGEAEGARIVADAAEKAAQELEAKASHSANIFNNFPSVPDNGPQEAAPPHDAAYDPQPRENNIPFAKVVNNLLRSPQYGQWKIPKKPNIAYGPEHAENNNPFASMVNNLPSLPQYGLKKTAKRSIDYGPEHPGINIPFANIVNNLPSLPQYGLKKFAKPNIDYGPEHPGINIPFANRVNNLPSRPWYGQRKTAKHSHIDYGPEPHENNRLKIVIRRGGPKEEK